jgi:hypothetical protein
VKANKPHSYFQSEDVSVKCNKMNGEIRYHIHLPFPSNSRTHAHYVSPTRCHHCDVHPTVSLNAMDLLLTFYLKSTQIPHVPDCNFGSYNVSTYIAVAIFNLNVTAIEMHAEKL